MSALTLLSVQTTADMYVRGAEEALRTLIPSSEKQGGTAEDSSSASDKRMGNFSTADIGMSPR